MVWGRGELSRMGRLSWLVGMDCNIFLKQMK